MCACLQSKTKVVAHACSQGERLPAHAHMFTCTHRVAPFLSPNVDRFSTNAGICQLNHTELLTTAGDGRMAVWDVRNAAAGPLKTAAPDSKWVCLMRGRHAAPWPPSVALLFFSLSHSSSVASCTLARCCVLLA